MHRADLHIHTCYSMDCESPLDKILERCSKLKIDCLAVADHGTIRGAIELASRTSIRIIVAEEVLTPEGEIMGLFLSEQVPSPIDLKLAIKIIKEQGGLVCIPHPYDKGRGGSSMKHDAIKRIIDQVDLIEIFNSRSIPVDSCRQASTLAEKHNLPGSAGSDAHTINEIGKTYLKMPEFSDQFSFKESLKQAQIYSHYSGSFVHIFSSISSIKKRLLQKH